MSFYPAPEDFSTGDSKYGRRWRRIKNMQQNPHVHELVKEDDTDNYYCWLCDKDVADIPDTDEIKNP